MREGMPPAQGAAPAPSPAPEGGGEDGGGSPQELIQKIDQMLGALAASASDPDAQAAVDGVRDAFHQAIEAILAKGGGQEPAAGPTTPEQGGAANVRPAGP